jgi:hypothetical protein
VRAETLERGRRDAGVRAVRAVDHQPEAREVGAEALEDVVEVAVGRNADVVDPAGRALGRLVEEGLDLLFRSVRELLAVAVEELDAVVLGRVVRGRDDGAEIEREQGHRGSREHAREHSIAARRDDAADERLLELHARGARVTPDEDAPASRPERRGTAEPLHELRGEVLSDHAPDTVGSEIPPSHGGGAYPGARGDRALRARPARVKLVKR